MEHTTGIFGIIAVTEASGVNQSVTTNSNTERQATGLESDQARVVVVNVLANASPDEANTLHRGINDTVEK